MLTVDTDCGCGRNTECNYELLQRTFDMFAVNIRATNDPSAMFSQSRSTLFKKCHSQLSNWWHAPTSSLSLQCIGWQNQSLPLIGWHSLLLILFSHQPRPAAAVHWTCSVATLFVGLTGTNLPSHFVPKFKSVYFGMIIIGFHRVQGFCIISTKILKIARFVELFNTSR